MKTQKCHIILIVILLFSSVLSGCINADEEISERALGLSTALKNIECGRYDIEIHDDLPRYNSIYVEVWYNENYSIYKISDLVDIKNEMEKYINANITLFSGCSCGLICYSSYNRDYNIPIPYIDICNYNISPENEKIILNDMEISAKCSYEQFKNIRLNNIDTLKIEYGGDSEVYSFDLAILSSFPELSELTIPSEFCESKESKEYIESLMPEDCNIEYIRHVYADVSQMRN